ncbi:MAG: hypothetical protein WC488_01080 [Candidatus Micrarchaeia archaeon]
MAEVEKRGKLPTNAELAEYAIKCLFGNEKQFDRFFARSEIGAKWLGNTDIETFKQDAKELIKAINKMNGADRENAKEALRNFFEICSIGSYGMKRFREGVEKLPEEVTAAALGKQFGYPKSFREAVTPKIPAQLPTPVKTSASRQIDPTSDEKNSVLEDFDLTYGILGNLQKSYFEKGIGANLLVNFFHYTKEDVSQKKADFIKSYANANESEKERLLTGAETYLYEIKLGSESLIWTDILRSQDSRKMASEIIAGGNPLKSLRLLTEAAMLSCSSEIKQLDNFSFALADMDNNVKGKVSAKELSAAGMAATLESYRGKKSAEMTYLEKGVLPLLDELEHAEATQNRVETVIMRLKSVAEKDKIAGNTLRRDLQPVLTRMAESKNPWYTQAYHFVEASMLPDLAIAAGVVAVNVFPGAQVAAPWIDVMAAGYYAGKGSAQMAKGAFLGNPEQVVFGAIMAIPAFTRIVRGMPRMELPEFAGPTTVLKRTEVVYPKGNYMFGGERLIREGREVFNIGPTGQKQVAFTLSKDGSKAYPLSGGIAEFDVLNRGDVYSIVPRQKPLGIVPRVAPAHVERGLAPIRVGREQVRPPAAYESEVDRTAQKYINEKLFRESQAQYGPQTILHPNIIPDEQALSRVKKKP